MIAPLSPVVVASDQTERLGYPGELFEVLVSSSQTGGRFLVARVTVDPGCGTPPHVHQREDEVFHILEGELQITVDGQPMTLKKGDTAFGPRDVPHFYTNVSQEKVTFLMTATGSNFEAFIRSWCDLFASGGFNPDSATALAAEYGIVVG